MVSHLLKKTKKSKQIHSDYPSLKINVRRYYTEFIMAHWQCKAFQSGNLWSVSILDEFGVAKNIPEGANEIQFLIVPQEHYTTLYTYAEENQQGLRTTTNFKPGTPYTRFSIYDFKSWIIHINTMHA